MADTAPHNESTQLTTGAQVTGDEVMHCIDDPGGTPASAGITPDAISERTLNSPAIVGNTTTTGTIDGRDVAADGTKLDGIEASATADQTDGEIETAYNAQVSQATETEGEEGTVTDIRRWSPKNVKDTTHSLRWKEPVRVATTADGTLATAYENGDTVDGITLATGDRILLKDQSTGAENGIYAVQASGAPVREKDWDNSTSTKAEGAIVYVREGTSNGGKGFKVDTTGTITIGTTAVVMSEFGASAKADILGRSGYWSYTGSSSRWNSILGSEASTSVPTQREMLIPTTRTYTAIAVYIQTNNLISGDTVTISIRINGTPSTTLRVQITDGETGYVEATGLSVTINAEDRITVQATMSPAAARTLDFLGPVIWEE